MLSNIQPFDWLTMIGALGAALMVAALAAPGVIDLYRSRGWLDQPAKKKTTQKFKNTHQESVPRGGGIVIFLAVVLVSAFFLKVDATILAILGGALILTITGVLDDVYDLSPFLRLVINILVGVLVISAGVDIKFLTNPLGNGVLNIDQWQWVSWGLTLFFIIWNINIVNWSKGVDGQMPGFVGIAAVFIGLLSLRFWNADNSVLVYNNTMLSMIVAGAFFGFLIWNYYPQKMMPGYGGGALGGYFLSVLAILSGAKVATMLMVLAIPTADAIFTIARRIIAGKSPFWGDRGHLHHKLLDNFGWGRRRIAAFYWLIAVLMGILSLFLNTQGKIIAILIATALTFIFLIWAKLINLKNRNLPKEVSDKKTTKTLKRVLK